MAKMKNKFEYYHRAADNLFLYKYNLETKKIYYFGVNGWKESIEFSTIDDLKYLTKIKKQEAALLLHQ